MIKIITTRNLIKVSLILLTFLIPLYFIFKYTEHNSSCLLKQESKIFGPIDSNLIECVGVIYIEKDDADCKYQKKDNCSVYFYDRSRYNAFIKNVKSYKIRGRYIYSIGDLNYGKYDDYKEDSGAFVFLPGNGKDVLSNYNSVKDLPHYFKLDSTTGLIIPYVKLEDIPEDDRKIFSQLLR